MLVFGLASLYILLIAYSFGSVTNLIIGKISGVQSHKFIIIELLGLTTITTLAGIFSLFFRINWEFQLALLIVSITFIFTFKPYQSFKLEKIPKLSAMNLAIVFVLIVIYILILNASSLVSSNPDTGIYHAQAIHWIEDYPAIPGLANLHARLGYNSSWLLLNAVFSFSFLGLRSFHFLTGILLLIASYYFASGIKNIISKNAKLSDFIKIGFLISIFVFILDQASSPGTDVPATIIEWILITEIVLLLERKEKDIPPEFLTTAVLAAFCITIKISAFPIILTALPILILALKNKRPLLLIGLVICLFIVILPFITRNLILSGYLVYPGPAIDLFKFDWRVPASWLVEDTKTIHWFAALPHIDQAEFYKMTPSQWIPIWFGNLLPRHKAILMAIIFLPVLLLFLTPIKKWRQFIVTQMYVLFPFAISIIGVIFWFLAAPTFRFGYGYLIGAVILELSLFLKFVFDESKWLQSVIKFAVLPVLLFGIILTSRSTLHFATMNNRFLLPEDYPNWSTVPCKFGNFTILCQAEYDSCWYSAFPCAIIGNENVIMRGLDFKQGFKNLENIEK